MSARRLGPREPQCPRSDAVLAIYLDGDVADGGDGNGYGFVCGETLRAHLLDCRSCQHQLQRARRLDAALAAGAGRSMRSGEIQSLGKRWFAAALAAPAAAAAGQRRTPAAGRPLLARSSTLVGLALAFVGTLFVIALRPAPVEPAQHLEAPRAPAGPLAAPGEVPANTLGPSPQPADILIASDAVRRRPEPRAAAPRATDVAQCAQRLEDERTSAAARLDAARELLAASRPFAPGGEHAAAALVGSLAGLGDRNAAQRTVHPYVLDLVAADTHFARRLEAQMQRLEARRAPPDRNDVAALTVAARLGSRALDAAILRAVRRHPTLAEPLAAALRCGVREAGGARLLLDAWQDLAARGALGSDPGDPARWFDRQPSHLFEELEYELRIARSAARRVNCLLALGFAGTEQALGVLLAHMDKAAHEEALAAAFALSHLPRRLLAPLVAAAARTQRAFLLRAALARAALPETAAWIEQMALSAEERTKLHTGPFAAFPEVAGWFRSAPVAASD